MRRAAVHLVRQAVVASRRAYVLVLVKNLAEGNALLTVEPLTTHLRDTS